MKRKILCLLAVTIVTSSVPAFAQPVFAAQEVAVESQDSQMLAKSNLKLKNNKKKKVSLSVNNKTKNFSMEQVLGTKTIKLSISAETKTTLTSSDEKVASVDNKGNITLNGTGTATITVKAKKTAKKKAATIKITLKVFNDLSETEMFSSDFTFADAIGKEYNSGDTIASDNLKLLEYTAFHAAGGNIIHAKFFGFNASDLQADIDFDEAWYNQNAMSESEIKDFYASSTLLENMSLHRFSDSLVISPDLVSSIQENKPQYLGVAYTYVTSLADEPVLKVSYLKIEYK